MEFIVYSRNYSKSDTLSEHSLRRIMKEKLIVKQRGKYHVNFRSSTVILKILFLMREFSSDSCFEEGFDRLMDILGERTSIGTNGAIRPRNWQRNGSGIIHYNWCPFPRILGISLLSDSFLIIPWGVLRSKEN